jgi:ABC-type Fe3+ transport system permease subunit
MAVLRRRLIIEPRFQAAFTFAFVRGVLVAVVLPAAVMFLGVAVVANNLDLSAAQQEALSAATHRLILVSVIAAVFLTILSALVGLILSHRYAGPLKRVESWSARILLGEPAGPLRLRPGDEMVPIATVLDKLFGSGKKK